MCIEVLLKNTQKEPLTILLELEALILSSPRATTEPYTLAKREAIRFLKALGGESFMNLIRANLPPFDKITFRELIHTLQCNFHDTLLELHLKRMLIREVSRNGPAQLNPPPKNPLPSHSNPQPTLINIPSLILVFKLPGGCCPPDLCGLASRRMSASGQGPASSASRVRSSPTSSLQFLVSRSLEDVFLMCIWIWWDRCLQARDIVIY